MRKVSSCGTCDRSRAGSARGRRGGVPAPVRRRSAPRPGPGRRRKAEKAAGPSGIRSDPRAFALPGTPPSLGPAGWACRGAPDLSGRCMPSEARGSRAYREDRGTILNAPPIRERAKRSERPGRVRALPRPDPGTARATAALRSPPTGRWGRSGAIACPSIGRDPPERAGRSERFGRGAERPVGRRLRRAIRISIPPDPDLRRAGGHGRSSSALRTERSRARTGGGPPLGRYHFR